MKNYNCKFNEKEATAEDLLAAIAWEMPTNKDGSVTISKTALARVRRCIDKQVDKKDRERQFEFETRLRKFFKGKKITRGEPDRHPVQYFVNSKLVAVWEFVGSKEEYHRGWIIHDVKKGDHILPRENKSLWHLGKYGSVVDGLTTWPGGSHFAVLPHRPGWPKQEALTDVMLDPAYHPARAEKYAV